VLDHQSRTIQLWNAQGIITLAETQTLTSTLLPGFAVAVRSLLVD
jgi:hypothetical protein